MRPRNIAINDLALLSFSGVKEEEFNEFNSEVGLHVGWSVYIPMVTLNMFMQLFAGFRLTIIPEP